MCRVVSTQLIEAGVDVDFPLVFRSASGIDSIAQAAGRCNREGKLPAGNVTVFEPEAHGMPSKGSFEAAAAMTRSTIRRLSQIDGDLLSLKAIEDYFKQLFELNDEKLDSKTILKTIADMGPTISFPYEKIAHDFQLIDNETVPIIIPWNEDAIKLMDEAKHSPFPASKARSLQPFVVQVYKYELKEYEKEGVVNLVGGVMWFLTDDSFYNSHYGLKDSKEVLASDKIYIF